MDKIVLIEQAAAEVMEQLRQVSSAQRLPPNAIECAYSMAYQKFQQGHFAEARNDFAFLATYRPTDVRFLIGMALTCRQMGNYEDAILFYTLAAAVNPMEPAYAVAIAECELFTSDPDMALARLERVLARFEANDANRQILDRAKALRDVILSKAKAEQC